MLPTAQFGRIKSEYAKLQEQDIALYVVFHAKTLQSGYSNAMQPLLDGQATMFTNDRKLGLATNPKLAFRKVLVDLKTMEILAIDPESLWGSGTIPLNQMLELCPEGDPPK